MKSFFSILLIILISISVRSQVDDDIIIGKRTASVSGALFDLSDPTGVNIEVSIWGSVKYAGRYIVPINTTFIDLMSYSGGPIENSKLSDIRILRSGTGTNNEVIKLNYDDLLWEERISTQKKLNPVLQSGDVILIPEENRYTFREDVLFILPLVSSIASIVTLIVTLTR